MTPEKNKKKKGGAFTSVNTQLWLFPNWHYGLAEPL
jgi:hypothetical protein